VNKRLLQSGDAQPLAAYDGNYLIDAYIATADAALKRQATKAPGTQGASFVRRLIDAIGLRKAPSRQ
jgi:hypothetical protein